METSLDCLLIVSEQDENLKTYAEIDGTLLVNQETSLFFGKTIDCELNVVRNIVDACLGDISNPTLTGTDIAFVDGGAGEDTITSTPITVSGTDIAFVDGGTGEDTITSVAGAFGNLIAGGIITISGSGSNDGDYTILSFTASEIRLATGSLIAEGAGASVTITQLAAKIIAGDTITVSGSASNDGTYVVLSVSAGIINVVTGSLTAEGAGASVTILAGYPTGGVEQNIRATVTIDGEDVTDSLIGGITIAHNKNYISTFSFQLGDPKYSPLVDSHIAVDSEVVITSFINGQEMKLFTGLVDNTNTDYDGGYKLMIKGRGYGKKLLEKTMTLISVEQSANKQYRGVVVEYIAGQGDITNVDIPIGDAIGIDHSFQDQSLWDMIQKECAIEGWFVRFDENAKMILKTISKKTTADWEYGEDKFEELGLETSDKGIINKVNIMGAEYETEVITIETNDLEVDVPESEYEEHSVTIEKTFARNEDASHWEYSDSNFTVKSRYIGSDKITEAFILGLTIATKYKFTISGAKVSYITDTQWSVTSNAHIYWEKKTSCNVRRGVGFMWGEYEFTISITIKWKEEVAGGNTWIDENLPNETTTSTIIRHQIKATVQDDNSIDTYGERKPNNEGTLQFPLAETEEQCKRIGEYTIIESHRFIKQPDYLVAFNPKLVMGCTVKLVSPAIGYDEEWIVEEIIHMLNIGKDGEIKARTRIGCVYYA